MNAVKTKEENMSCYQVSTTLVHFGSIGLYNSLGTRKRWMITAQIILSEESTYSWTTTQIKNVNRNHGNIAAIRLGPPRQLASLVLVARASLLCHSFLTDDDLLPIPFGITRIVVKPKSEYYPPRSYANYGVIHSKMLSIRCRGDGVIYWLAQREYSWPQSKLGTPVVRTD